MTIGQIAGIDHLCAARLRKAGIRTVEAFLERARAANHRRLLSEQTGIDCETLSDLVTSADFMRLEGMGGRYCALLRAADIHSLAELGELSPQEVMEALLAVNHENRIVRRLPSPQDVRLWVIQASEPGFAVEK